MEKCFTNWQWHNETEAQDTPLSAGNLQAINDAIDEVDDRVVALYSEKLSATTSGEELGDVVKWDGEKWVNGPAPGGGGTGTTDYQDLSHKPTINGVLLSGNKTSDDLGCVSSSVTDGITSKLTASDNLVFQFSTDGEGNYGYLGADGSFVPFKSGGSGGAAMSLVKEAAAVQGTGITFTPSSNAKFVVVTHSATTAGSAEQLDCFASVDLSTKFMSNTNTSILALTKSGDSFTLKWGSQYTATVKYRAYEVD